MGNDPNFRLTNTKPNIKNILTICLFAVIIFSSLFSNGSLVSQAMASGNSTSANNTTNTPTIDNTSLTVVSNPNTISAGSHVTLTATVTDTSSSPITPTGTITWNDGNAGGSFQLNNMYLVCKHMYHIIYPGRKCPKFHNNYCKSMEGMQHTRQVLGHPHYQTIKMPHL